MRLSDGRLLAYAVHGPEGGTPVLFLAGAGLGRTMTFGREHLDRAGAALITIDRPGMGGSTPHGARSLTSTAADIAELLRRWGGRVPVVANSQGAPFGLALAAAGAASRLVLVSPVDEVAAPAVFPMLAGPQRAMVEQVRDDPAGVRAFLADLGAEGMEAMVVGGADEADREVYSRPDFLSEYRATLQEGFEGGGAGYVTDTMLAMSPWELDLGGIRCEVELWMGERDRHHSPDQGSTLASRIPAARRIVVPDAGGALLWTHSALILEAALRPAGGSSGGG